MRLLLLFAALAAAAPAATYYVTIAGIGGEAEFEQRFSGIAGEIDKLLKDNKEPQVVTLRGSDASKAKIQSVLADIARRASASDSLVVMLIGHGGFDGVNYKFAIPGPDLTASELAGMLDRIPASRQLVVNMTSASGASMTALSKQNRVVITATRTGTEKNAVVFSRYWAEALRDGAADTDKNGAISALEAYRYADQKTVRFYESQKRLATEHALLDDTGKGEGVRAPGPENGQGLLAAQMAVMRVGQTQIAAQSGEKQQLFAKKEKIEQEIERLKYQKAAMPVNEYRKKLSALLLDLARTQEELEK
ncbi:MAG: hypothetical protein IRZ15_03645 [Bryobacteraceae bacterium]|nr:hypothetical protein [Bryobacteraceae bacterium]